MLLARLKFSKCRSTSKVKVTGSKCWYPQKGLVCRNTQVKYDSSNPHCSKLLATLEFSKEYVKLQGQGHSLKNVGISGKVLYIGLKFQTEFQIE